LTGWIAGQKKTAFNFPTFPNGFSLPFGCGQPSGVSDLKFIISIFSSRLAVWLKELEIFSETCRPLVGGVISAGE
jgi:hypothetical protein